MQPTLTEVMTYLWDNYVELTDAKRVVVISHGSATRAMVDLISSRPVTKLVKAIVQVVGMQHSPHYPRGSDDIQGWFKEVSYLAIPETHSTFLTKKAMLRRYGVAKTFAQERVTKLFEEAMPSIDEFVSSKVEAN